MHVQNEGGTMDILAPRHVFFTWNRIGLARHTRPERIVELALVLDETVREQLKAHRRVVIHNDLGNVLDEFKEQTAVREPEAHWQILPVPVTPGARKLLIRYTEMRTEPMGAVLEQALKTFDRACRAGREGYNLTILEPGNRIYGFLPKFR